MKRRRRLDTGQLLVKVRTRHEKVLRNVNGIFGLVCVYVCGGPCIECNYPNQWCVGRADQLMVNPAGEMTITFR